jgi:hypothetical protein
MASGASAAYLKEGLAGGRRGGFDLMMGSNLGALDDFGGGLQLVQRCLRRGEALMRGRAPHRLGALEDAGERVVIAGRNGVGFVIVAARAADAESHDAAADDVDLIGHDIHLEVVVHRLRRLRAEREQRPVAMSWRSRCAGESAAADHRRSAR